MKRRLWAQRDHRSLAASFLGLDRGREGKESHIERYFSSAEGITFYQQGLSHTPKREEAYAFCQ